MRIFITVKRNKNLPISLKGFIHYNLEKNHFEQLHYYNTASISWKFQILVRQYCNFNYRRGMK